MRFTIIKAFLVYAGGVNYEKQLEAKKKIAKAMGIPKKRLAQIINGKLETVSFLEMVKLAQILKVDINELFETSADA